MMKNSESKYRPGQRIIFKRIDGVKCADTIRECFMQDDGDEIFPALVLTEHSWCAESDVVAVVEELEPVHRRFPITQTPGKPIMSIREILDMLEHQAAVRAPENDEAGCLLDARDYLEKQINSLENEDH